MLKPQIIFMFNNRRQIVKTIFLYFGTDDELKKDSIFGLYLYFRKEYEFVSDDYTHLKNHILLTLTTSEIRYYIRKEILKTDKSILLFSIWDNIDYSNVDDTVFNPFTKSNPKKNNDQTVIYSVYPNVVKNSIFCVLTEDQVNDSYLCSKGVSTPKLNEFIESIGKVDLTDKDIVLDIEENSKEIFHVDLNDEFEASLRSFTFFKTCINKLTFEHTFLTGDDLIYLENPNPLKNKESEIVIVYNKNLNEKIFTVNDSYLTIFDRFQFDELLLTNNLRKHLLRQKKVKNHTKLLYNITFTENVYIDFDISFFLETTKKTKNIFLDRSKKINIMTSSNHILYSSYISNFELFIYITKLIIYLQLLNGNVVFTKQDKKLGNRYFSRYCQGERKPLSVDALTDESDFINYNDTFYKHIRNEGDAYRFEGKYNVCSLPGLSNIGFIAEIYEGYNVCFPCCYKKPKHGTELFKTCIGQRQDDTSQGVIDPYIHIFKQYRIIMNRNKIGFLIGKLDEIFNHNVNGRHRLEKRTSLILDKPEEEYYCYDNGENPKKYSSLKEDGVLQKKPFKPSFKSVRDNLSNLSSYIIINPQNRIILAKDYVVYGINQTEKDFLGFDKVKESDEAVVYIVDDVVYFNPNIIERYVNDPNDFLTSLKILLVIQYKLHVLKVINKYKVDGEIVITDLTITQKKMFIDRYIDMNPIVFKEDRFSYSGTVINDQTYLNDSSTKYYYAMDNISLREDTLGYYITDVLYRKYFDTICTDNINEHKKVFLNNLRNFSNVNLKFNKRYTKDMRKLIEKVTPFLNQRFIDGE